MFSLRCKGNSFLPYLPHQGKDFYLPHQGKDFCKLRDKVYKNRKKCNPFPLFPYFCAINKD